MLVLAHVFGLPVEESLLPWLAGGSGTAALTLLAFNIRSFAWTQNRRLK